MRVEKGKVRAPEIGRVWLNSSPLSFRQLRGRAVIVDFWDYTCVNCIRTLPYVQAWHERYRDKGLTVIGVHTPEFTFAQYESNVERGIREFGLTYPIVIDSDREIWKAFANRYWPTKYLLDKDGYLRWGHFGEGGYGECEQIIQELLREIDPAVSLPALLDPLREEDHVGAVCYRPSGELYLGNRRGRIGNEGGFKEDQIADYAFADEPEENFFYASGRWASTAEYLEAVETGPHTLRLKYEAAAVNLVMASPHTGDTRYAFAFRQERRRRKLPSGRLGAHVFSGERSQLRIAHPGTSLFSGRGRVRLHLHQLRRSRGQRAAGRHARRVMKRVVAGIIVQDGKILVCQRTRHQTMPLKWEFPGGKIEEREQPRDALRRELEEELGILATIGDEVVRIQHEYPNGGMVELRFFVVRAYKRDIENRIFKEIQWADPKDLPKYDFLEADLTLVRDLAAGKLL
jgi:mutator protein MutT